jgi:hypothetical protein
MARRPASATVRATRSAVVILTAILLGAGVTSAQAAPGLPVDYVDPLIGTANGARPISCGFSCHTLPFSLSR